MKTRVIAASAVVALLLIGVVALAYATTSNGHNTNSTNHPQALKGQPKRTVGEILTFQGLRGHFNNLTEILNGVTGNHKSAAGRSVGNFIFNVTAASSGHYILKILSGDFSIAGTTYTVTGGTATLNAGGRSGNGTGTADGGATFAIRIAGIHINHHTGLYAGNFKLDVKIGQSEYHVLLGTNGQRGR